MTDAVERARTAWKRGISNLLDFCRGDFDEHVIADPPPGFMSRQLAHARLAGACMRADILVEYIPGRRVVTDSKLGGIDADAIAPVFAPEHSFDARPVNVDWCGKDAIAWGYDL